MQKISDEIQRIWCEYLLRASHNVSKTQLSFWAGIVKSMRKYLWFSKADKMVMVSGYRYENKKLWFNVTTRKQISSNFMVVIFVAQTLMVTVIVIALANDYS